MQLPRINSIFLIVTEDCNMCCPYCFIHQKPAYMSLEVAMDAVRWVIANAEESGKTPMLNFFGGEPTLAWDDIMVPVTKWVRNEYKKPFTLNMTSNGVLLDQQKIDYMKKNSIGLLFSIDGDKPIMDQGRPLKDGGSSFDLLAPKIPMILEAYPNMTFRSTFAKHSLGSLVRIHKFAVEQGYNNIFCIPNSLDTWSPTELKQLKTELRDLADYWVELFQQGITIDFKPFADAIEHISKINIFHAQGRHRDAVATLGYGKCGLGCTAFASVDHKGDIYSCQEIVGNLDGKAEKFHIGNIYTGINDEKRLQNSIDFDVQKVHSSRKTLCTKCDLKAICEGSCVMHNYLKSGDVHILDEVTCVYRRTAIKEMQRMMNILGEERNETFKAFYMQKLGSERGARQQRSKTKST